MFQKISLGLLVPLTPVLAYAHWGHVGELAGHGHVIAIGALAAAAALAAALLKPAEGDESETEESETEAEGEVA